MLVCKLLFKKRPVILHLRMKKELFNHIIRKLKNTSKRSQLGIVGHAYSKKGLDNLFFFKYLNLQVIAYLKTPEMYFKYIFT